MRISVVTVSRNSASTILDTLESVSMQTHADVEHLVIDGLSTDETLSIVLSHRNTRMLVVSECDNGIYDAMNKGLALASGDIVGFLNSDDFYEDAEVLNKIANVFEDPTVDACYSDLVYVGQDTSRVVRYWKSRSFVRGDFARGWCPPHPTFYVRKSVLKRLGSFDVEFKLAADFEFMLRYLELGRIRAAYIPHVLVRMRLGGATNLNWNNVVLQNKEIFAALRKNLIPFSVIIFSATKVFNRFKQFFVGLVSCPY